MTGWRGVVTERGVRADPRRGPPPRRPPRSPRVAVWGPTCWAASKARPGRGRTAATRQPRRWLHVLRLRAGPRPVGDAALHLPRHFHRVPDHDIRAYTDERRRRAAASQRRGIRRPPRAGMRWTRRDLAARMAEPWFDPAGLLVATDGSADARLPLDQAALARPRRGLRRRHRPRRRRAAGSDVRSPWRACTTSSGSASRRSCCTSRRTTTPPVSTYSRLGFTHAEADTHVMYAATV